MQIARRLARGRQLIVDVLSTGGKRSRVE